MRIVMWTLWTLGLCLCALPVWAQDSSGPNFEIINNSGDTLKVDCAVGSHSLEMGDGQTQDFTCTSTVMVQVTGGNPEHYFTFQCTTGQVYTVTVTAPYDVQGALHLEYQCGDPPAEEPATEGVL